MSLGGTGTPEDLGKPHSFFLIGGRLWQVLASNTPLRLLLSSAHWATCIRAYLMLALFSYPRIWLSIFFLGIAEISGRRCMLSRQCVVSFVRNSGEPQIQELTGFGMQYSFELNSIKILSAQTDRIFLKIEFLSFVHYKRAGLNILTGPCI